jgi:hypothetical protein
LSREGEGETEGEELAPPFVSSFKIFFLFNKSLKGEEAKGLEEKRAGAGEGQPEEREEGERGEAEEGRRDRSQPLS